MHKTLKLFKKNKFEIIGVVEFPFNRFSKNQLSRFWQKVDKLKLKHKFLRQNYSDQDTHMPSVYTPSWTIRIYLIDQEMMVRNVLYTYDDFRNRLKVQEFYKTLEALMD